MPAAPLLFRMLSPPFPLTPLPSFPRAQIPFTYTHLMAVLVKIHLTIVSCVAGTYMGRGFQWGSCNQVVWGVVLVVVNLLFYEGTLAFHAMVRWWGGGGGGNWPFGDGAGLA